MIAPRTVRAAWAVLGGEFDNPRGVAVDQASGDVYVVERIGSGSGARVQKFTGDGEFVWMWGWICVRGRMSTSERERSREY